MTQSPKLKLLIHIIAKNATHGKTTGETLEILKNDLRSSTLNAREELDRYIAVVRAAKDADQNWTEDEICQMIIDKLSEKDPPLFRN